ncbi:hypothetical protein KHU50_010656 [Colletotrichum sp. SAR 10_65]|nr:hypothetical protein KHU50_010656 [Colletotrichum sp. SAR 10_65]
MDNTIQLRHGSRLFHIDLVESPTDNFDVVAISVIKHSTNEKAKLLGGTVITDRFADHPNAADHRELVLGMEVFDISPDGNISAQCCEEAWMACREMGLASTVKAHTLRQRIVAVATERMLKAKKVAQAVSNAELHALCKKLASEYNYELVCDDKQISTKESHSQVKAQLASENQRLVKLNHQLLLANVELKEDVEIFRLQANEAERKAKRLTGRLSNAETETEFARDRVLEVSNELEEAHKQLKKTRDESRNLCLTSGRNIMDKDKRIRKLEQQLTKLEEQTQQNSTEGIPELGNKLEITEKASAAKSKKSTKLDEQLADQFEDYYAELFEAVPEFRWLKRNPESSENASAGKSKKIVKQEEQLTEQFEEEVGYQELKSDLDTTKTALKEKTDELAAAKKKHAEELQKAEGSKEKCRCKDKESYLESVEEHVENLRGTMENVLSKDRGAYSAGAEEHGENMRGTMEKALKHVSIYQGRKRRRTEGPDFEY